MTGTLPHCWLTKMARKTVAALLKGGCVEQAVAVPLNDECVEQAVAVPLKENVLNTLWLYR